MTERHQAHLEKKFCMGCGAQLRVDFVDMFYDHDTGKQRFNLIWSCPKWKWYWDVNHTHYKSDDDGNTYAFQL